MRIVCKNSVNKINKYLEMVKSYKRNVNSKICFKPEYIALAVMLIAAFRYFYARRERVGGSVFGSSKNKIPPNTIPGEIPKPSKVCRYYTYTGETKLATPAIMNPGDNGVTLSGDLMFVDEKQTCEEIIDELRKNKKNGFWMKFNAGPQAEMVMPCVVGTPVKWNLGINPSNSCGIYSKFMLGF